MSGSFAPRLLVPHALLDGVLEHAGGAVVRLGSAALGIGDVAAAGVEQVDASEASGANSRIEARWAASIT